MSARENGETAGQSRNGGTPPAGATICPACGATFECGMKAGVGECWCARLPPVAITPGVGCLCPRCLAARAEA